MIRPMVFVKIRMVRCLMKWFAAGAVAKATTLLMAHELLQGLIPDPTLR